MTSIIGVSALLGSLAYLITAIAYSLILRKNGILFLPAFLFSILWTLTSSHIYTFDFIHASLWSATFLLTFQQNRQLPAFTSRWLLLWSIPCLSMFGALYTLLTANQPTQFHFYLYLLCCTGTLLICEQFIRNSSGLIKATGIGIGALFLYNLYFYASTLIFNQVSIEIIQARGLANTTVGLMLCLAPLVFSRQNYQRKKIALSRPLVFTTTSLVLAGSILLFVSAFGYLLRVTGDGYAIMQPFFLFLGVLLIGYHLGTSARRARTRVWINKHFFQTKFDYNQEWRNLSDRLTVDSSSKNYGEVALHALLPIYNGTGGSCYLVEEDRLEPVYQLNVLDDPVPIDMVDCRPFLDKMLHDNWMYLPAATDPGLARFNELIPEPLNQPDSTLLILPLISQERLIGLMTISADTLQSENFDWEDLDLMRMVGKQLSNFIAYQMLSSELVVTRQFEAFNRFTTFVMHDLKNLIAQQALVVENAARFINNPEFIADAIATIDNSVKRMNRLLLKINQSASSDLTRLESKATPLIDIIERALSKCEESRPIPKLVTQDAEILVDADPDHLVMAFTHIISNAQEACDSDGEIMISISRHPTKVECRITDNGIGMSQKFIDTRLFKPFDSTKENKGMGIGAYQYKQIISNIGGRISVTSKIGEGSCFTVTLPLSTLSTATHPPGI